MSLNSTNLQHLTKRYKIITASMVIRRKLIAVDPYYKQNAKDNFVLLWTVVTFAHEALYLHFTIGQVEITYHCLPRGTNNKLQTSFSWYSQLLSKGAKWLRLSSDCVSYINYKAKKMRRYSRDIMSRYISIIESERSLNHDTRGLRIYQG